MSCPIEIPIKKDERDNITEETDVFNPFAISGKAGKYISIDNGPIAVKSPNINIRELCFCDLLLFILSKSIAKLNSSFQISFTPWMEKFPGMKEFLITINSFE